MGCSADAPPNRGPAAAVCLFCLHADRTALAGSRALPPPACLPADAATLGGSLTYGRGASAIGRTNWAALTGAWLRQHFPGATLHNGAVAASPSEYMSFCVQEHLPTRPVDLIIVSISCAGGWGCMRSGG